MSNATGTMEDARQKAELLDCDVIDGDENTLLIDFDGEGQQRYADLRDILCDSFGGIVSEERWQSSSKLDNHEHLVVKLGLKLTVAQRIALQAILGSDPMREILAILRQLDGDTGEVSLLFKPRSTVKALPATTNTMFEDVSEDELPF